MKTITKLLFLLAGIFALALTACTGGTGSTAATPTAGTAALEEAPAAAVTNSPGASSEDAPSSGDASQIITLHIGPTLVECAGVTPQLCMQVKENPTEEYQLFYDQIEGFTPEEGYTYELTVETDTIENPPADGSTIKYTLVAEVSKTPMTATDVEMDTTADPFGDTMWTLTSYTDSSGAMVSPVANSEVTLHFQAGGLSGNASCNRYFGSYTVDGNNLDIGPIGSTEMACGPEALAAQEGAYLAALGMVTRYRVENGQLILTNEEGKALLTYTAQASSSIAGTTWQGVGYHNGKDSIVPALADAPLTAVFGADGSLSGVTGCNNYSAVYTVQGTGITISEQIVTTRRACTPEQAAQESAYLAALPKAASYRIDGDHLELHDTAGALLASYTAVSQPGLSSFTWVATAYHTGGQAVVSVIGGTRLTAVFNTDGSVAGSSGCNSYGGTYTTDGNNITIGTLVSTLMACAEANVMQQETAFLAALEMATTYQIAGDTLELRTADGSLAASFTAEPQ